MKPLLQVSADDVPALVERLRDAVLHDGPAVLPVPVGADGAEPVETSVPDAVAVVVETSGSTDAPKRVALSASALVASADATSDRLGEPGQWLLALPAHYIAGVQVLVRGLVAGTRTVVLGDAATHGAATHGGARDDAARPGGFDPYAFAEASARLDPHVPHFTSLVPVQLARIVEAARRDPFVAAAITAYDAVLVGGQALAPEIADAAAGLGVRVVRTYGSSETAGGCVYDGLPLDGVDVRIVDGLVELAGPVLAEGYLDDPGRTAAAFALDRGRRWYRTGDLGALDAGGRLRIRGRADDVIISGGVKVALGEVERAVRAMPGMSEAVVVRVADAEWGERAAVVVAGASGSLDELAAATDAAGLPPAGRPVRLVVLDVLPRLASGKPDRRALAALPEISGHDGPDRANP
ncbi:AMP-binding protein [Agromyces sp. MMS24-JH15]|uniref:AMP-binding protein n=1 Tax=Agromyces sp. MMS24-JH15 TaxID=3243765 RepID=UPI00374850F1